MSTNPQDGSRPTVVLVHGAFADGSSWNEVIKRLQAESTAYGPANPLRGISIDSAYDGFLEQIPGPVLAVAHSYGGAVITNAATNANNVVGLVYVAALPPTKAKPWELLQATRRTRGAPSLGRAPVPDRRARRRRQSLRSIPKNSMRYLLST